MDERKLNSSISGSGAEDEELGDIEIVRRQIVGRTAYQFGAVKPTQRTHSLATKVISTVPWDRMLDCASLYLSEESWPRNCKGKINVIKKLNTQLLEAVEDGKIQEIKRLQKLGANPNATCRLNHVSACHVAAMKDNVSLSLLMKSEAKAWRKDKLGRTPLHLAAWEGHRKKIAVLLSFPEDLQNRVVAELHTDIENDVKRASLTKHHLTNFSSDIGCPSDLPEIWQTDMEHNCRWIKENLPVFPPGWTALHAASSRAQNECIQLLLAAGADLTARDQIGSTSLDVVGEAHYWGHEINIDKQSIQIFVKGGGKFHNTHLANTPLHTAVEVESEKAVEELLNAGASVTCLNSKGLTAMHICVEKRLRELLKLLVNYEFKQQDQSANVDAKDTNGLSVLHAAVKTKWLDGMRIALNAGADVFSKANDGESPLHTAAATGDRDVMQKLLPHARHNIDFLNQKGDTALIVALTNNHIDIVQMLSENGASLSVISPTHQNVLQIAACHGYREILEYLLGYGGHTIENLINDVSDVNRSKTSTPIIYAVRNNHPDCVELLLKKGAKIDSFLPSNDFWPVGMKTTALHEAAFNNYLKIANIILDHDCDLINKMNHHGQLPLHVACFQGNREIISLFLKRGADISRHAEYADTSRTPAQILMDNLAKPTSFMEEIFDSYISSENMDLEDKECKITIKYDILLPNLSDGLQMKVIKALVDTGNSYGQRKLLQHPLIESFLCLKWKTLAPIFYGIIMLYASFVLSLNIYVVSIYYYGDKNNNNDTPTIMYPIKEVPKFWRSPVWKYLIYVTISIIILKEIIVFMVKRINYFFTFMNWIKIASIGLSTMVPSIVVWRDEKPALNLFSPEVTRQISTVALVLSWIQMTTLLARFPCVGFYLMMFRKVAVKFCKIILSFTCLLIGFSLCFMIEFHTRAPFDGPIASLTKTLVMMTAEYDYMTLISKEKARKLEASIYIQRVMFVIFIIITSLVLINLIVGVAVNDVNRLENIGQQQRLEKQVEFLDFLEKVVFHRVVRQFLPNKIYAIWLKRNNVNKSIVLKPGGFAKGNYNKVLPAHIRDALCEKAQAQTDQLEDEQILVTFNKNLAKIYDMIEKLDRKLDRIEGLKEDKFFKNSLNRYNKKTEALPRPSSKIYRASVI